ncbi:MAG: peptidoglycan DD-metalloendopeptidase family protein [Phototrophicales bacterium]|nr:peptidoglycan DD-metalloendopeptidase family protein [Phototrophicales bacterium]
MSHAIVLPDDNFDAWLNVTKAYAQAFEKTAVIRSPAGNDLNRYHTITAVAVPKMWFNDAPLDHIRRAYPLVVRVDVITASTPAQLQAELTKRIDAKDRYGEKLNTPQHLFERFILTYPTKYRPARITRRFSTSTDGNPDTYEGIDINTQDGEEILCASTGTVVKVVSTKDSLNYGAYIQIATTIEGITYTTTYGGLKDIKVTANTPIKVGAVIGKATDDAVKLVVQSSAGGLSEFKLPNVVDPTLFVYWANMRLRPTGSLRVRAKPAATDDVKILATLTTSDLVETQEPHGRILAKVGVLNQWIKIRRAGVDEAYCAAEFLRAVSLDENTGGSAVVLDPILRGTKLTGINLDLDNPAGNPDPAVLAGMGWVRLKFNVSRNPNFPSHDEQRAFGNQDVNFTYNRYLPYLQACQRAGLKVIMILGHQTYGEGGGFTWESLNDDRWRTFFTPNFLNIVKQTAQIFKDKNLIHAYQIWNEQDTLPQHIRSAIPVKPEIYGYLLSETIKTIRSVDSKTLIITGGLVTGAGKGLEYINTAFRNMPSNIRPDGIGFHAYGNGPAGNPFTVHGDLASAVNHIRQALPTKPVWITEWGVLGQQGNDGLESGVSQYVGAFYNQIKTQLSGKVACAVWYGYGDGMDDGYGLVNFGKQRRQSLFDAFLKA